MKKRVVAYARVSSKSRSQAHSLEFQKNYWNEKLSTDPDYEYLGLFYDHGISGKTMKKRPSFMQMINKALDGEIDIIFTKSVQRFARNTEELLDIVHQLRDIGVSIIFEKENINTLEITSDLFLTVAAVVAEEDLNRYSANVTWSINESYKRGEPISFGGRIYGFNVGKKCELTINPKEAKVVVKIFEMYANGYSLTDIQKHLEKEGIPSSYGNLRWARNTISEMLKNEKYIGDVLLHKSYNRDGIKHKNLHNEVDQYYVTNHHKPIISKELWDKVQAVFARKYVGSTKGIYQKTYPFTGLIECSCCHKNFAHKMNHSSNENAYPWYRCSSTRDKCTSSAIRDDILEELFIEAFNEFVTQKYRGIEEDDLFKQVTDLEEQEKELTKLYSNGWILQEAYAKEVTDIRSKIESLNSEIIGLRNRNITNKDYKPITVFDPTKVEKFIKKCVMKKDTLEFHFYNGVIISKKVINRRIYHYVN
ncbi:MAG: recombinase family protein [Bacilli bacterium]|nr:recombinase family protein [Bacilli bacterium]